MRWLEKRVYVLGLISEISTLPTLEHYGRVSGVKGLLIEISGPLHVMSIGSRVTIEVQSDVQVECEVVGFRDKHALCLPFGPLEGVRMGCRAVVSVVDSHVRQT